MSTDDDDYDRNPVGFLGWLRNRKGLVWLVVIALIVLSVGASTIVYFVQLIAP